jgi:hypothetical protein
MQLHSQAISLGYILCVVAGNGWYAPIGFFTLHTNFTKMILLQEFR